MPTTTLLIDNSNLAVRAFYGTYRGKDSPVLSHSGFPTNAIATWTSMVSSLIAAANPDRVIFALDGKPEFRMTLHPGYKASRPDKIEELKKQLPVIHEMVEQSGFEYVYDPKEEADDAIATLAGRLSAYGDTVKIASGDKDFGQCITNEVTLMKPLPGGVWKNFGMAECVADFGVKPSRVAAWLALVGDVTDDIPGIDGIGEKGASNLLADSPARAELIARLTKNMAKRKNPWTAERVEKEFDFNLQLTTARILPDMSIKRGSEPEKCIQRLESLACHKGAAIFRRLLAPPAPVANPITPAAAAPETQINFGF